MGSNILAIVGAITLIALGTVAFFAFMVVGIQAGITLGRKLFGIGLTD